VADWSCAPKSCQRTGNTREKYEQFAEAAKAANALPVPWVESADISSAVVFLASDEARYVTGVTFPVDAGFTLK
jgi:NAD(P)-dependent dehydrogenase (short-subunit alcohol dehydrogenase family)